MGRRTLALLCALGAVVAAATVPALALGGASTASTHTVVLKNIRFHPGTLNVNRGDKVMWLWRDGELEHNVTFKSFHSRTQGHGSYTVRFIHRGTFNYECTIHGIEGMRGKVIVH